jgi:hypothetical protein
MVPEILDTVLHTQLLTLQVRDRKIVDRAMAHGFGNLIFEMPVLQFQVAQMDLYHGEYLRNIEGFMLINGKELSLT